MFAVFEKLYIIRIAISEWIINFTQKITRLNFTQQQNYVHDLDWWMLLSHMCILHGGFICIAFCPSGCLSVCRPICHWIIIHISESNRVRNLKSCRQIMQASLLWQVGKKINSLIIWQVGLIANVRLHFLMAHGIVWCAMYSVHQQFHQVISICLRWLWTASFLGVTNNKCLMRWSVHRS